MTVSFYVLASELSSCYLYTTAVSISFSQSTYIIAENGGSVRPVVVLSSSVAKRISVQIRSNDKTATGEYINIIINNVLIVIMLQGKVLIIILDHTMSQFLLE